MARETLASLRQDRDDWKKLFEQANAELEQTKRQLRAKFEDTDEYQSLIKQLSAERINVKSTLASNKRYNEQLEKKETELAELRAKLEAVQTAQNEPLPDDAMNDEDEDDEPIDDEPIDDESEELIENVVAYLKEAYANNNKSIGDARAKANVNYWRKTAEGKKQFDILIEYFESRLSAASRQMQEQDEKIQELELQAKDSKSTNQVNATMGNYAALSELSKRLKENQAELEASKTAQNALQSDYNNKCRELQELQKNVSKGSKNPFGAGRKRAYTDRIDEIKQLHDEGMSGRKIAEALGLPSATVTRYIRRESKQI